MQINQRFKTSLVDQLILIFFMSKKTLYIIISILSFIIISGSLYYFTQLKPMIDFSYSLSRQVIVDGKTKLGCRTHFVENKDGAPKLISFVPTNETTCPSSFIEKVVTKEAFIKDLQNSKDWGVLEYSR